MNTLYVNKVPSNYINVTTHHVIETVALIVEVVINTSY